MPELEEEKLQEQEEETNNVEATEKEKEEVLMSNSKVQSNKVFTKVKRKKTRTQPIMRSSRNRTYSIPQTRFWSSTHYNPVKRVSFVKVGNYVNSKIQYITVKYSILQ